MAFKWTGKRFSSVPLELFELPGEKDHLRPSNINFSHADTLNTFAVSFGSPSRKAAIFNLVEDLTELGKVSYASININKVF